MLIIFSFKCILFYLILYFYLFFVIYLFCIVSLYLFTYFIGFDAYSSTITPSSSPQLLVQALVISRLDYCNALLAGLPSNTIKPLQMIENAVARLVFSEPKRAHVTPLFISLHWLLVAAGIKFNTLMLAYRTATGSAPSYFHSLMTIYVPSRSERRLVVPSQRGTKSLSRTFSFNVPGWWNELPNPIPDNFQATYENSSLTSSLDFILK